MKIDCCLYTGPCPFRHLPGSESPGGLLNRLGLETGIFLPFPPLFYHRPHAGFEPFRIMADNNPRVRLHAPSNPLIGERLPASQGAGLGSILLAPGLHQYSVGEPRVNELVCKATEAQLPVVLFRNLGDPRLAPDWLRFLHEPLEKVADWIDKAPACRLVLSHFFPHELDILLPVVAARPDLYVEIGAFSSREGWFADTLSRSDFTNWLYGSGAPLHYSLGNRLSLISAAKEAGFPLERFDHNARLCYGI